MEQIKPYIPYVVLVMAWSGVDEPYREHTYVTGTQRHPACRVCFRIPSSKLLPPGAVASLCAPPTPSGPLLSQLEGYSAGLQSFPATHPLIVDQTEAIFVQSLQDWHRSLHRLLVSETPPLPFLSVY